MLWYLYMNLLNVTIFFQVIFVSNVQVSMEKFYMSIWFHILHVFLFFIPALKISNSAIFHACLGKGHFYYTVSRCFIFLRTKFD